MRMDRNRYIENGDYYVRIETDINIEFNVFNNYEDAMNFCNKRNIDVQYIKIWKNYDFK
jgi:hypothetical protein